MGRFDPDRARKYFKASNWPLTVNYRTTSYDLALFALVLGRQKIADGGSGKDPERLLITFHSGGTGMDGEKLPDTWSLVWLDRKCHPITGRVNYHEMLVDWATLELFYPG